MVFVPCTLTYDGLMNTIEDIVRIDLSSCNIKLMAIMTTSGRRAIPRIKNDRDVTFLIDNGLDGLHEQYLFQQDGDGDDNGDSGFDLDGDGDSGSSSDIDGEVDSDSPKISYFTNITCVAS
ncbi:hypothetical protein Q3G72_005870 [Acer saccharum]|nr:hypothetical protein Q3G72_005870 [Acer saccharum]